MGTLLMATIACESGRQADLPDAMAKPRDDSGVEALVDAGTTIGDPDSGVISPGEDSGTPPTGDSGTPPSDGGTPPGSDSGTPPTGQPVGSACTSASECATGNCISGTQAWWETEFAGGYCTLPTCSEQNPCPAGSDCFITDDQNNTTCLRTCMTAPDCGRQGYDCFEPGACLPETTTPPPPPPPPAGSSVGGPCMADADCADMGAACVPEADGWIGGYCVIFGCSATAPCPAASDCFTVSDSGTTACLRTCTGPGTCGRPEYACLDTAGACIPACTATSCGAGEVCDATSGLCVNQPCTPASCAAPLVCDAPSGQCVVDVGMPPPGPVPACSNAPAWQCAGGEANCGQVVAFEPDTGPGYWDYPINGETAANEYRSYVRRDVMMMVKYAAYMVDCLAANWSFGNFEPLGLGDMSESNGDIPGTSVGSPGHPAGTHTDGRDMDIGYYQLLAPDNTLRPVCDHISGGVDQYHCVAPPDDLDPWRTALFLGLLHESPQIRVIGVDGQVGPLVDSAITQLCASGWLNTSACNTGYAITYETTDMGRGWFYFHHHHFHISFTDQNGNATLPNYFGPNACLTRDCRPAQHDHLFERPVRRLGSPKQLPISLF